MKKKIYFAFDVETPNRHNDRISSIGITAIEDGRICGTYNYLVNPEVPFDYFNIQLTNISPSDVKDAPTFPAVWEKISMAFTSETLIAHNAHFDLTVLFRTLEAYGIALPQNLHYFDTLPLVRGALPDLPNHKLGTVSAYYGIDLDHHQSGSDSRVCAEIFLRLMADGYLYRKRASIWDWDHRLKQLQRSRDKHSNPEDTSLTPEKELVSMLAQISEGWTLSSGDVMFVNDWFAAHGDLIGKQPFDRVSAAVQTATADGILEQSELDELLVLFQEVANPLSNHCVACPDVEQADLSGKKICLTGEFEHGSRSAIGNLLIQKGAEISQSVTKKTAYLVVGGFGSNNWVAGNYGSKVKLALALQEKGNPIQIMRENDFFDLFNLT